MQTRASQILPRARTKELIVRELSDEVLIYDKNSEKAHCLNQASAFVWKHCDGKRTVKDVTLMFEREFGAPVDEDVVWLALNQLRRLHLLEEGGTMFGMRVSRRDLVRKYLPAALSLPLILSIPAATAAQAGSNPCTAPNNRPNGCACTSFTQCLSNCCSGIGGGGLTCQPVAAC